MLRPLHDRVLVEVLPAMEKTPGGLFIPATAQEDSQYGVVVKAGPGRVTSVGKFVETQVKCGDKVLLPKRSGVDLVFEGKKYLMLRESEILGVVEE